jgi:hypothetical protein
VPFLKFSRDKRGYENFYLVESANRGKPRTRLLYWFRTPPNIKVGRTPFDADMRRALEQQNPDVLFDWDAIVRTPIPPPSDTERWRERRRLERAMRAADSEEVEAEPMPAVEAAPPAVPVALPPPSEATAADELSGSGEAEAGEGSDDDAQGDATSDPVAASNSEAPSVTGDGAPRRRRRRRRRGRKPPQAQGEV